MFFLKCFITLKDTKMTTTNPLTNIPLVDRQQHRLRVFETNMEKLKIMRDVKKGTRYRKWLYNRLRWLSQTIFDTDDDEYTAIQKFPRGIWYKYDTTFRGEEHDFMLGIAIEMGSMDY